MESAGSITQIGRRARESDPTGVTGGDEYNQSHSDWKIVRQVKAITKTVKEHVGLGSVLGTIAIIIAIGAPAVKQGEINGTYAKAIDNLTTAQKENDIRQERALTEAVGRIEAGINRAVDLAQQNREDMRSMRENMERRVDKIETLSQSNWNKMVEVSNRMGIVEAKQAGGERPKEK